MAATNHQFVRVDGTRVPPDRILGHGGLGVVIQDGPFAIKIPSLTQVIEVDGQPVDPGRLTPEEGHYDERAVKVRQLADFLCERLQTPPWQLSAR